MVLVHVPSTVNRHRRLARRDKIIEIMLISRQAEVIITITIITAARGETKLLTKSIDERRSASHTTKSGITQVMTLAGRNAQKAACGACMIRQLGVN